MLAQKDMVGVDLRQDFLWEQLLIKIILQAGEGQRINTPAKLQKIEVLEVHQKPQQKQERVIQ